MVRKVQPNIERFAGSIAELVQGNAHKTRAGKVLKKSKFQLDRKKQRKLKKEAKKTKRNKSLPSTSEKVPPEDKSTNDSKDKIKKKKTTKKEKNSKEICSLQSEEKMIFESADSIRYTKEEAEIANKQDDKVIRKMEKHLGIRKNKNHDKDKTPKSLDYDGLGYILHYKDKKDNTQDPEKSGESYEKHIDEMFSAFDEEENISDHDDGTYQGMADYDDGSETGEVSEEGSMFDNLSGDEMQDIIGSDMDANIDGLSDCNSAAESNDDTLISDDEIGDNNEDGCDDEVDNLEPDTKTVVSNTYVPPALRNIPQCDILKRKLKGIVNKVSTSNLKHILHDIELLYQEHPRGEVNKCITSCVNEACLINTIMPARLCAEHMLLIASLSASIGPEFVSPLLEELAVKFSTEISGNRHGKLLNNIVAMFCYLYALKGFSCVIIFDIINILLKSFTEPDLEVLLYIFKSIGLDIRKDDPQALKNIIEIVNKTAAENKDRSSRFAWLVETLTAVKNNNVNKIPNYDKSDINDIQKAFKTVVKTVPNNLQLSLQDLLDAKEKGRWWLVGAAWVGKSEKKSTENIEFDSKILALAKKNHMNTIIRKNIFCIVMSSHDYEHCYERLLKLNLKDKQQREIIHVTMICALKCKSFNPYYTKVIKKFCESSKSFQITTQFSIWDRLKDLKSLNERKLSNFTTILTSLICSKTISLAVLKIVNFAEITNDDIVFFKGFFKQILNEPEISITEIFGRVQELPLESLKNGIKVFMKHFLKPELSDVEKKNMKIACKCF